MSLSNFAIRIHKTGAIEVRDEVAGWKTMAPSEFISQYGDYWASANDGSWVNVRAENNDESAIIEFGEPGA